MASESSAGLGPPPRRPPDPGGDTSMASKAAKGKHHRETNAQHQSAKNKDAAGTSGKPAAQGDTSCSADTNPVEPVMPIPRLEGWDPAVTNRIKATMAKTWSPPLAHVLTGDMKRHFAVATAVYPLHDDAHLRTMTADEEQAFAAYMTGDLDLPAPPTFLTCTATTLKRAGRQISEEEVYLRELHEANGGTEQGNMLMKRLMTDALRISFDGLNTMSFVFPSKRMAKPWEGAALRFRTGAIVLESARATQPGVKPPPPQVAQHYAVNVLGVSNLDPFTVMTVFNGITGNRVIDIRQRGLDGLNEADNDYWTLIFADMDCPPVLRGVTCIVVQESNVFVHHFKRLPSPPCMRCFKPHHHHSRCKVPPVRLASSRATRSRKFTGSLPDPVHFNPSNYVDTEFMSGPLEQLQSFDMAHSTGNIDDIPLAPIHVEETQQPEASTSQQRHNSDTSPMVESVVDDGYRLQRRQKNKPPRAAQAPMLHRNDPGITDDPEVKKTAASPPTTNTNEENAGKESAPKANTENQA